uniref:Uncharacterized protein n=1 Tax=Lactuca sativa TaxID=4236 RepID=A0A9R1W017_LACSA|nr:hypothetical protein LSAT_V11C300119730 [Lactuca sativa]
MDKWDNKFCTWVSNLCNVCGNALQMKVAAAAVTTIYTNYILLCTGECEGQRKLLIFKLENLCTSFRSIKGIKFEVAKDPPNILHHNLQLRGYSKTL